MSTRRRTPALCLTLALAATTHAQRLDLGAPSRPDLGDNAVTTHVSRLLDRQIEARVRQQQSLAADFPENHHRRVALDLAIELRRLALELLDDPNDPDDAMRGLLIAAHIDQLDDFGARLGPPPPLSRPDQRADWITAHTSITRAIDALRDPPRTPEDLAHLEPAILTLDGDDLTSRWINAGDARPERPAPADLAASLAPNNPAPLAAFLRRLHSALRIPEFADDAAMLLDRLDELARVHDALDAAAPMLEGDLVARIRLNIADVAMRAADRDSRQDALVSLRLLTRAATVLNAAAALRAERLDQLRERSLRTALGELMTRVAEGNDPARIGRALGVAERTISVAAAHRNLPKRYEAEWRMRRAWRVLDENYLDAEKRTLDELAGLIADVDRLAHPETVSLIARHQDAYAVLQRLRDLPGTIAELRAESDDRLTRVADALDEHIEKLAEPDTRDAALARIDAFLDMRAHIEPVAGEALIRGRHPALVDRFGDRLPELARIIERRRDEWRDAWTSGVEVDLARDNVLILERLGALLETYVTLLTPDVERRLIAWAALEPASNVARNLADDLADNLTEPLNLIARGRDDSLLDALRYAHEQSAAARLIARLARDDRVRGFETPVTRDAADIVSELAIAPGPDAWLVRHRERLADISVWTWEWRHARRERFGGQAETILEYLNEEAAAMLDLLPREDAP